MDVDDLSAAVAVQVNLVPARGDGADGHVTVTAVPVSAFTYVAMAAWSLGISL